MILEILAFILVSWIFWAFARGPLSKYIGFKVCAICAAVAGTWIILLGARLIFGFSADSLIIGILMGQSITGIMYAFEDYVKKKDLNRTWLILRIFIILIGTLVAYVLLRYV